MHVVISQYYSRASAGAVTLEARAVSLVLDQLLTGFCTQTHIVPLGSDHFLTTGRGEKHVYPLVGMRVYICQLILLGAGQNDLTCSTKRLMLYYMYKRACG